MTPFWELKMGDAAFSHFHLLLSSLGVGVLSPPSSCQSVLSLYPSILPPKVECALPFFLGLNKRMAAR